jgi:hypothetical protein
MTNIHPDTKFLYFTDTYEATLDGQVWTIEAVVEVIR